MQIPCVSELLHIADNIVETNFCGNFSQHFWQYTAIKSPNFTKNFSSVVACLTGPNTGVAVDIIHMGIIRLKPRVLPSKFVVPSFSRMQLTKYHLISEHAFAVGRQLDT
jgi:hypothetical protein